MNKATIRAESKWAFWATLPLVGLWIVGAIIVGTCLRVDGIGGSRTRADDSTAAALITNENVSIDKGVQGAYADRWIPVEDSWGP